MVLYLLYVKAELENVESLEMTPETLWHLDVSDSTGQDVRKGVVLSEKDVIPIAGGRSHANFVLTWPGAKKASQISIVRDVKNVTRPIQMDDSGQYVPIVGFECRGLEPIAWSPIGDFQIKASRGSIFRADDLRDDWSEFDEDTHLAVGIFDVVSEFRVSN
uniref:Uncharacterized protein AlNc14C104G6151 n=1 Tax=Albugo laibachii Nc14 TaxID=890382 RepID=F0WHU4_9STRA|nr:conserved hypothetical protein [Albugo laibachii Nc14]|eukprot:CCA20819.1 conserved hypothetical protein [Albugo laibachii Nc14]